MNLGHLSLFLANFQLSRVDISKRKILPNYPKNIFLAWQNYLLIFNYINQSKTPHHRPAKTVFSTVPSNSDWQKCEPVEIRAGWRGNPLASISVSQSCKEQLKIGLRWPVVWRLTFSGVGRMITCRRLNILCRVNTKGKWQIQRRMSNLANPINKDL